MEKFLPDFIAYLLANDMNLIIDTTYALIESHRKWKSKLSQETIKLSFEFLSLVGDEKEDFYNYIACCALAKNIKEET